LRGRSRGSLLAERSAWVRSFREPEAWVKREAWFWWRSVSSVASEGPTRAERALTGTVRWWKDDKGYGRITGDDGYVYFAHFADIEGMSGYRSLDQGQRVRFEWLGREGPNGRRAAKRIRWIDQGEEPWGDSLA
jgi:cold shock protein